MNNYLEALEEIRAASEAIFAHAETEEEVCELEQAICDVIHSVFASMVRF